jgi:hypothetical protein
LAKKEILKRGFKADAERKAKAYRIALSIHPCAPLCAFKLAGYLTVPVYPATDFFTHIDDINNLNCFDSEWSALTMITKVGNRIIVHNPFNSVARQQSDVMHELAHIICDHKRCQTEYDFEIPFGMRQFDELQEEEAKCLGSTLQLPTPCLLWAKKREMLPDAIAIHFNASVDMVIYRMNMTGISKRG